MKRNITKTTLAAVLLFTGALHMQAQNKQPRTFSGRNPKTGVVRCASVEYGSYLEEGNTELTTKNANFENWISQKIEERKLQRNGATTNEVITIPVVVHVIHNGDAVGSGENILDGQVISQITVLNQDFRKMAGTPGENTDDVGADTQIEFCLAQVKPDGTPFNGIDRVDMGQTNWATFDDINLSLKPATIWDPEQYFNIWVVRFTTSASAELNGILGYAQFPEGSTLSGVPTDPQATATSDGVVIGYRYFGSSAVFPDGDYATALGYDRGRTTTHEVGHALGLRHIWGDGGNQSAGTTNCNATDYCDDTPYAKWDNWDCNAAYDTCPAKAGNDMTNNYMDYTNDTCMNIFTQDQMTRMRTVLENAERRAGLLTSTVCQQVVATPEFKLLQGINLYPNPTQGVLTIATQDSQLPDSYVIYNSLGQTIANVAVKGAANLTVDTSAYSNGVYFIKVDKGNATKTLKFIKN